MNKLAFSALALTALLHVSCSHSENDGRVYSSGSSPLQGKMGVSFKRVKTDTPVTPPTATTATGEPAVMTEADKKHFSQPPGLLDRADRPDEVGSDYWMHGEQSPNPVQSKMGVRVQRRKK